MKALFSVMLIFFLSLYTTAISKTPPVSIEEKKTSSLIPMHKKTISKSTGDIPNHHREPMHSPSEQYTLLKKHQPFSKKEVTNPYLPVLPIDKCFQFEGERSQTVTFNQITPEALKRFHKKTHKAGQYTRSYGAILSIILVLQASRFVINPLSNSLNEFHWQTFKHYTDRQKRNIAAHHFTIILKEVLKELAQSQPALIKTFSMNLANFNEQSKNYFITTAQALEHLEEQRQNMSYQPSALSDHTAPTHHSHAVSEPILHHMSVMEESEEEHIIRKNVEFNKSFNTLFENCGDILTRIALKISQKILKNYTVHIPSDPAEQDRLSAEALQQRLEHITTCE